MQEFRTKNHGFRATLIISNEEMKDIMKRFKSLEDSGLSIKGVSQTIENETKEEMCMLGTTLLGNMLAGKGTGE